MTFRCERLLNFREFRGGVGVALFVAEVGEEVELERLREASRGAEGDVDVAMEHLHDVGTRGVHAFRELGLRHPQLLHPKENAAQKQRADFICGIHRGVLYHI